MSYNAQFFSKFSAGIHATEQHIALQTDGNFHYPLYFAHLFTLMEQYLGDVFIYEISTDRNCLVKLSQHPKFQSDSLKIPFLMHNSVEDYLIFSMQNMVWHRLNEVDVLYRQVLGISLNTSNQILHYLKLRHDIVHRNGFDITGNPQMITKQQLLNCLGEIVKFISNIDKQYQKI